MSRSWLATIYSVWSLTSLNLPFYGSLLCPLWALFVSTYFALYGPFLMPFIGLSLYGSSLWAHNLPFMGHFLCLFRVPLTVFIDYILPFLGLSVPFSGKLLQCFILGTWGGVFYEHIFCNFSYFDEGSSNLKERIQPKVFSTDQSNNDDGEFVLHKLQKAQPQKIITSGLRA